MKRILAGFIAFAFLAAPPLVSVATTFFTDTFGTSTLNSATPAAPTATSTSYELISTKTWRPTPSIASGHLIFGIPATTAGTIEAQALFAAPAITLVTNGDYIELKLTFTVISGLLAQNSYWGVGMYSASGVAPIGGGLNGTATGGPTAAATGYAQNWQGYVAQIAFTGLNSGFYDRQKQTATADNDQDLVTISGSSTKNYYFPKGVAVGTATNTPSVTLRAGSQYTEVLTYTLTSSNALVLDWKLYTGPDTTGTLLSTNTATTGTTPLTTVFDGLAFGWYAGANTYTNAIDVNSITVSGKATAISGPPDITSQPSAASVPAGGSCAFMVSASGYNMTYQWHRYGTNLLNAGNISGATSDMLVVSLASSADVASGANGYYVTVFGAGGYSTNSITNSLSLRTAANLTWAGSANVWDLNNTADWLAGPVVFNYGDSVTFDDTGIANGTVNLTGRYLSAASVTVNAIYGNDYVFSGMGSFAGPGKLLYIGGGHLTMNNANSYSGGTLISNATAHLVLNNYNALGTGPVTLAKAGGQMEIVIAGSGTVGINGDIVVADDFTMTYDANSAYGAVLLGNLSGTAGKTLTINYNNAGGTASRVRIYGANTVCSANINLADSRTTLTPYQSSGSQTYNGVISGSGAFMQKGTTTYLNGDNTYSGGTTPATGFIGFGTNATVDGGGNILSGPIGTGPLLLFPDSTTKLTDSGGVLASGSARTVANPIQYQSGTNDLTLIIGGTNALTLSGAITLNGNDGVTPTYTNRIFQRSEEHTSELQSL